MNIKTLLGRAAKVVVGSLLLFTSVSHAQTALYISDGNGHITTLTGLGTSGGTFTFPSGGGSVLTNVGSGTVSLGGNFTTSGGAYSLQFNLTNNTTLTLPTSGTLLANPFLNIGDIMYASATGTPGTVAVLPIGGPGQVLEVSGSNTPEWATVTGTGSVTSVAMSVPSFLSVTGNPITSAGTLAVDYSGSALPVANGGTGLTTINTGDILYGSASNTLLNLGIGSATQVLTVSAGGLPEWDNAPTGFANPMTNTGDMIYSSDNTGTPAALPIGVGTTGYVLTVGVSGLPEWDPLNGGSGVVTSVSNTDTTLTISPTTGAVVAQINPAFSNAWSATQSFPTTDAQGSAIDASINAASGTLINGTQISGNISGNAGGLSSTLAVASGGTGLTTYSIGDLLVATGTTTLASLPDVAAGSVLLSGGLNTAPTWGQVPVADISATGTASNTTYLRGDGAWSTIPAGFSNPMTTNGDIIYQSGGVPTELHSTNTVGQVLTVSSTNGGLAWQGVVNSIVGSANEVLVSGGSGSDVSGAGIVLSLPQPVSANASPTFQALTLGDATHAGIIALSNTGTPTYTSLEASASGVAQTYTLPPGYPISANEMLVSTTTGGMSWAPQNAGTVTAIGVTTANGVSGSSSGGATPSLTITLGAITPSSVVSAGAVSGTTVTATTAASGMTIGSGVNATNLSSASTVAAKNINFPNASGNLALVTGTNGAIAESDVTGLTTDLASKGSGTVTGSSFATDGVMYATGSTGIASTAALTSGQLLVGSTGAPPVPATLGTSNGVSATTGAGTLSIGLGAITPTSVTAQPTTNVASAVIEQTTAATPSADIFDVTASNGTTKYISTSSAGVTTIAGTIQGSVSGSSGSTTGTAANATGIATTLNSATVTAMYPTFVTSNSTTTAQAANVATAFTFVPSTGTLGATIVNATTQYNIGGTNVLNATTLGSGVTGSALTSVGTLTSLTTSGAITFNTAGTTAAPNITTAAAAGGTAGWIQPGANSTTNGNGSAVTLQGGIANGTGAGGTATLNGGAASATAASAGGVAAIAGGAGSATGAGAAGGAVTANGGAGNGTGANAGGAITMTGGTGSATGAGGNVQLTGGTSGSTSGAAGTATLYGGTGSASATAGGGAFVWGGKPGATGIGGFASLDAANGGSTSGAGGADSINAGNATSGAGGVIFVGAGAGAGSNQAAGGIVIDAGNSTGTGVGSTISFKTAPIGTTGTTTNATAPAGLFTNGTLLQAYTVTNVTTASTTLTAAELIGRTLYCSANSTITFPTATAIVDALPGVTAGMGFIFYITMSTNTLTQTLTMGTGDTYFGVANIATTDVGSPFLCLITNVGTPAVSIYRLAR